MTKFLSVEDAKTQVVANIAPRNNEPIGLTEAAGRVLARDVTARLTQPPFHASVMDGYAVRKKDLANLPVTLRVIGEAAAGHVFSNQLCPGETVRIFTGAPVPEGADTVVMQENTARDGEKVTINQHNRNDVFIRPKGMDFAEGQTLLGAGTWLAARHIALAAAGNCAELTVVKKPKVAILATGDELVYPGERPKPDQIISSIPFGLKALIDKAGGSGEILGIAKDTRASLIEHLDRTGDADILITIGGVSVGDHDIVRQTLVEKGMKLDFWKIAMRPGRPMIYGQFGRVKVLGVPGNPVSAMITARIFLVPLIQRMLGLNDALGRPVSAIAGADIGKNGPRQHYMRASLEHTSDGIARALPRESQDSSLLATLSKSDCLIIRPPHADKVRKGDEVKILKLDF